MFYRRKIILSLLQLMNNEVEKTKLQKLLFLYSQRKPNPEYEFVPYKFGCYSYSAKADLNTMVKKEYIIESDKGYSKNDTKDYLKILKTNDKSLLSEVVSTYGEMSNESLIKHTYVNFPYFAIKSTIAKKILKDTLYERIENVIPKQNSEALFTIGYEGISLENYLNKLVKNNVKILVDVRRNPLSMKYGFSKTLLKRYCENLGIEYTHLPQVGIESSQRRDLQSQKDYDQLFQNYERTTLQSTVEVQKKILELLRKNKRIALTCFESNVCQCHRLPLAQSILKLDNKVKLIHI